MSLILGQLKLGSDILALLFFQQSVFVVILSLYCTFLADRTATHYDRLLAAACCLSVCDAVHCGSQGWCTPLKVAPACS